MDIRNIIRIGKVSSINHTAGRVRVVFSDKDSIVSSELPLLSFEYNMPSVGDSVLCIFLLNGISKGFCLGKYYSDQNNPGESGENIYFKDLLGEGFIRYDKTSKTLTLNAQSIAFEGNVSVLGNLNVAGNLNVDGNITYEGTITDTTP
jgi:phage baseplate assembly protein gpV